MTISIKSNWEGFLPRGAWVMAKRCAAQPSISSAVESSDPAAGLSEAPASGVREFSHEALSEASAETLPSTHPEPLPKTLPGILPTTLPESRNDSIQQITQELQGCTRCKLCVGRTHIVIGDGTPQTKLVFVGEGPGEQEDLQGRPFVGKAGQLLDRMIQAIGLRREDVYIANVVKCRPPGNRNPEPDEIAACSGFLHRQLRVIRPTLIVALGKFAAQTLLRTEEGIVKMRGKFREYQHDFGGDEVLRIRVMPTFHPAYLLRNPSAKREVWEDLQKVAAELGLKIPQGRGARAPEDGT